MKSTFLYIFCVLLVKNISSTKFGQLKTVEKTIFKGFDMFGVNHLGSPAVEKGASADNNFVCNPFLILGFHFLEQNRPRLMSVVGVYGQCGTVGS